MRGLLQRARARRRFRRMWGPDVEITFGRGPYVHVVKEFAPRPIPVETPNAPPQLPPDELDHEPCLHDFTDPPLCRKCGELLPGEPE